MPRNSKLEWDFRFLEMAKLAASWSKDKTKIGCVLTRDDNTVVSLGFNELPPGIDDEKYLVDRDFKNRIVIHAEDNALLRAPIGESTEGWTAYVYGLHPCGNCASKLIAKGIKRIVYCQTEDLTASQNWKDSLEAAKVVLDVCGAKSMSITKDKFEEWLNG